MRHSEAQTVATPRRCYLPGSAEWADQPQRGSNALHTARYTAWTFLPRVLFAQFSRVANLYFLLISLLQLLTDLSPTGNLTTAVPLAFVIALSMLREAIEDRRRHRLDAKINNRRTRVLRGGEFIEVLWRDLCVGDVVRVEEHEEFPADILVLSTSMTAGEDSGFCYADTSNLDGETALKMRQAASSVTQQWVTPAALQTVRGYVEFEAPSLSIYHFRGAVVALSENETPSLATRWYEVPAERKSMLNSSRTQCPAPPARLCRPAPHALACPRAPSDQPACSAALTLCHLPRWHPRHASAAVVSDRASLTRPTCVGCPRSAEMLLRGATLRNTRFVHALVLYTGGDTKIARNTVAVRAKGSNVEARINQSIFFVFCGLVAMCTSSVILQNATYITFFDDAWLPLPPVSLGNTSAAQSNSSSGGVVWSPSALLTGEASVASIANGDYGGAWHLPYVYRGGADTFSRPSAASWVTFLLLYNTLWPISLYVALELCKVLQAAMIELDISLYDPKSNMRCLARTTSLNEDLGQVRPRCVRNVGARTRRHTPAHARIPLRGRCATFSPTRQVR